MLNVECRMLDLTWRTCITRGNSCCYNRLHALNDVVSSQDRRLFALVLCRGALRYYSTYWIISTGLRRTMEYHYQLSSLDDGGTFRQSISTQHLEATTGMFTFLCFCVCAVSRLSAFHTDRCRLWLLPVSPLCEVVPCVACVRWILCIMYVA